MKEAQAFLALAEVSEWQAASEISLVKSYTRQRQKTQALSDLINGFIQIVYGIVIYPLILATSIPCGAFPN